MIDLNSKTSAKFGLAVTLVVALSACSHQPTQAELMAEPIPQSELNGANSQPVPEPVSSAMVKGARKGHSHSARHAQHRTLHKKQSQLAHHSVSSKATVKSAVTVASVGEIMPPPPPSAPMPSELVAATSLPVEAGFAFNWIYLGLTLLFVGAGYVAWAQYSRRGSKGRRLVLNS